MERRRANFARAFTLIELILVLALVALIVSIAIPSLTGFANAQGVVDSADQVMALARWARSESIARAVSFRLNFDPVKKTFWLTVQQGVSFENALQNPQAAGSLGLNTGDTTSTTVFGSVGEESGRPFTVPQGVTFDCMMSPHPDGTYYVEFQPSGRCDPGTIQLKGRGGQVIEVGCLTATEQYHVLSDEEKLLKAQIVTPPQQTR